MDEKIEELTNEEEAWRAARDVNRIYAELTIDAAQLEYNSTKRNSIIWIQDFRFWLAPRLIREIQMLLEKSQQCPIASFVHIAFPPPEIFQKLKHYKDVLEGILGNDVVCFNTKQFCLNFVKCCDTLLGLQVSYEPMKVYYNGRIVTLHGIPVGTKYDLYANLSNKGFPKDCHETIEKLYNHDVDYNIIFGVDRLDYTKGLVEKVNAFKILLEKYPELDGKVQYLQVAVPVRTVYPGFENLRREYEMLISETNTALKMRGFDSRISVILEKVPHHDLPVFYKKSQVGFITPHCDALNLVALEYVASQTSDPGVLVLSKHAGAAEFLPEALKVDPTDVENMAHILHRALTMSQHERKARMGKLRKRVKEELDINRWVERSLDIMLDIPTSWLC